MNVVKTHLVRADATDVSGRREELPDNVLSFVAVARHNGMSYRRIADLMNRIGLPTARGGTWHASTVARVADRVGPFGHLQHRRAG